MPRVLALDPIARIPDLRVLAWHGDALYAGRGYDLVRWAPGDAGWQPVASYDPGLRRRLSVSTRLSARLFRDGFHAMVGLPDETLVVALPSVIAILRPGGRRLEPSFAIPRGTRPLAMAATPDGRVFWGEYFDNPAREAVHVYGLNASRAWEVVYTFPPGSIRHIHSITHDPYAGCLWILTGDEGDECRILRASPDWTSVQTVLAGTQQTRAVTLVVRDEAIYFATDSPWEQNHIYRLSRGGHLQRLAPVAGSSFWSCAVAGGIFFSTAIEPSPVNRSRAATLYGSADGHRWAPLLAWERDRWPSRLFQYANIILPAGVNASPVLAVTGLAVRCEDEVTWLWRVRSDAQG